MPTAGLDIILYEHDDLSKQFEEDKGRRLKSSKTRKAREQGFFCVQCRWGSDGCSPRRPISAPI